LYEQLTSDIVRIERGETEARILEVRRRADKLMAEYKDDARMRALIQKWSEEQAINILKDAEERKNEIRFGFRLATRRERTAEGLFGAPPPKSPRPYLKAMQERQAAEVSSEKETTRQEYLERADRIIDLLDRLVNDPEAIGEPM